MNNQEAAKLSQDAVIQLKIKLADELEFDQYLDEMRGVTKHHNQLVKLLKEESFLIKTREH